MKNQLKERNEMCVNNICLYKGLSCIIYKELLQFNSIQRTQIKGGQKTQIPLSKNDKWMASKMKL